MSSGRRKQTGRFKGAASLARKGPFKKGKERILIVCEGAETEPNYFEALRVDLGVRSADVRICGKECGSDPMSVLEYALELFEEDSTFDNIFCVFDKEGTQERERKYKQACSIIDEKKLNNCKISYIRSVPSFEYWYILHYKYTCAPFVAQGKKSCADMVISALKKEMPKYNKSEKNIFQLLKPRLSTAKDNARKAIVAATVNQTDNPLTEAHLLVAALEALI